MTWWFKTFIFRVILEYIIIIKLVINKSRVFVINLEQEEWILEPISILACSVESGRYSCITIFHYFNLRLIVLWRRLTNASCVSISSTFTKRCWTQDGIIKDDNIMVHFAWKTKNVFQIWWTKSNVNQVYWFVVRKSKAGKHYYYFFSTPSSPTPQHESLHKGACINIKYRPVNDFCKKSHQSLHNSLWCDFN